MHRYDLHPRLAADKVPARGPKAASTRPHTRGRLLIAAALAVVALAAVGMSETAMAQTTEEIKIGVLSACPPSLEAGPLESMKLARDAWNREAVPQVNTELTLEFIDIRGDPQSPLCSADMAAQRIIAAVQNGTKHFIAPSDELSLLHVQGFVSASYPNTILVSPASQATFHPSLYAPDNLFRLVPNGLTQGTNLVEQFDRQGVDRALIVTDVGLKQFVDSGGIPDDLHDHYILPSIPIYGPGDTAQNVQSLTDLNNQLVELIDQHGKESVAVFAATTQYTFVTMANVIANNPQLGAIDDVKWFGYHTLGYSPVVTGDPVAAKFADDVDMNVIVYEIATNEINAPLATLHAFSPAFINYNFASYDAVHLLADAIVVGGGVDSLTLNRAIFDVANNDAHPVNHTDRLLGEGAIGDYMLNPATGDLLETRAYVTYEVVQSGGGYVWAPLAAPSVCR